MVRAAAGVGAASAIVTSAATPVARCVATPAAAGATRAIRCATAAILVACVALGSAAHADSLPTFAAVKAAHRPSDLTLLDRDGVAIQTMRTDPRVRRLAWLPLDSLSPALLTAIVLSEDRRFYEHSGVDWPAAARSAWGNLWNTRTRGASTLTMQLAGLLDAELARPAGGRGAVQKLSQALTATRLEARWRKTEILEAYLNRVPFRGELVGVGAMSETLFGKHASGLDSTEAAIAAALLRAPNAPAARVARRACAVLETQRLPCAGIGAVTEAALARRGSPALGEQLAPHVAAQLLARARPAGGEPALLATTLDAGLQRAAAAELRTQLAELAGHGVEDGAVLVLDNASGEVRAWVGSSGSARSSASAVDAVLARRQPGSTLKPFVYGLAFERRLLTPATLLDDSPAQIATGTGLYLPQNYDGGYKGWVSARSALGGSLNVPAVRVGTMLGADALAARLDAFGLALQQSGGHYGASLALGSAEVTLLALTNAYRALANGGVLSPVRLLRLAAATANVTAARGVTAPPGRRVADAASTFLVTDILADNNARARSFGLDSVLATRGFAAVKTGTSKDMRDNWCLGFSDRYTVGVWVGNAGGAPMHAVSGTSGAAPVWAALMRRLHADAPSRPPAPPAGVQRVALRFDGAHEAARDEWFVAGTAPAGEAVAVAGAVTAAERTASARRKGVPVEPFRRQAEGDRGAGAAAVQRRVAAPTFGITSPRDGSLFALDPDIPPTAQRITFEGEPGTWWLDGRRLGQGARLRWAPWPGRHVLELRGVDGRALQRIAFEVRGAVEAVAAASAERDAASRRALAGTTTSGR